MEFIPKPGDYVRWKLYRKSSHWRYGFVLGVADSLFDKVVTLRRFGEAGGVLRGQETHKLADMRGIQLTDWRIGGFSDDDAANLISKFNQ